MISIKVKTNTGSKVVSTDITETPKRVFESLGIDASMSMVNLNCVPLSGQDFVVSFEALGVEDGTTATMSALVKSEGASA